MGGRAHGSRAWRGGGGGVRAPARFPTECSGVRCGFRAWARRDGFVIGRKLRYGMIGGGRGAFIGAVHRIAAQLDGQAELVAGAFSSDPQRSRDSAADLFVAAARAYGSYQDMAVARSEERRVGEE